MQETRQRWNSSEKCVRSAWYCCSSGGRIDQDEELGKGLDWFSVGGGGRHLSVRDGKSKVRGS